MKGLYTEVSGSGPPLALWHGWGLNLRVFDQLRAALSTQYRVIAVDLPGHGRSPWSASLAGDSQLELLLQTLPADTVLLGWSLGAQFALHAAAQQHNRVRSLILVNSTPRFRCDADWPCGVANPVLERFSDQLQHDYRQTVANFLELQVRGSAAAPRVLQLLHQALLSHGAAQPEALAIDFKLLVDSDLRVLAGTIEAPALVIGGQYDRVTPPGAALALSQLLANAHHIEIKRAGHAAFLSHPAQVLAAMHGFLADA